MVRECAEYMVDNIVHFLLGLEKGLEKAKADKTIDSGVRLPPQVAVVNIGYMEEMERCLQTEHGWTLVASCDILRQGGGNGYM